MNFSWISTWFPSAELTAAAVTPQVPPKRALVTQSGSRPIPRHVQQRELGTHLRSRGPEFESPDSGAQWTRGPLNARVALKGSPGCRRGCHVTPRRGLLVTNLPLTAAGVGGEPPDGERRLTTTVTTPRSLARAPGDSEEPPGYSVHEPGSFSSKRRKISKAKSCSDCLTDQAFRNCV